MNIYLIFGVANAPLRSSFICLPPMMVWQVEAVINLLKCGCWSLNSRLQARVLYWVFCSQFCQYETIQNANRLQVASHMGKKTVFTNATHFKEGTVICNSSVLPLLIPSLPLLSFPSPTRGPMFYDSLSSQAHPEVRSVCMLTALIWVWSSEGLICPEL